MKAVNMHLPHDPQSLNTYVINDAIYDFTHT